MAGTPTVYAFYYGSFNDTSKTTINTFIQDLNGSAWYAINKAYYNGAGMNVSGLLNFGGAFSDPSASSGNVLTPDIIKDAVKTAVSAAPFTVIESSIFFFLVGSDVTIANASVNCGFHLALNGSQVGLPFTLKVGVAFSPNQSRFSGDKRGDGARNRCSYFKPGDLTPNNDFVGDSMANIVGGLIAKTVTDPLFDGWYDINGLENADKCAWRFGTKTDAPNGADSNVVMNGRYYLVQQNWLNNPSGGGSCVMAPPPPPPA